VSSVGLITPTSATTELLPAQRTEGPILPLFQLLGISPVSSVLTRQLSLPRMTAPLLDSRQAALPQFWKVPQFCHLQIHCSINHGRRSLISLYFHSGLDPFSSRSFLAKHGSHVLCVKEGGWFCHLSTLLLKGTCSHRPTFWIQLLCRRFATGVAPGFWHWFTSGLLVPLSPELGSMETEVLPQFAQTST
jgi:hypothetical protein